MAKAVETAIGGATIRQIVDAGDGASCAQCGVDATWVIYQEHYDGQDDYRWYACDDHLAQLSIEAIEFDDDDGS